MKYIYLLVLTTLASCGSTDKHISEEEIVKRTVDSIANSQKVATSQQKEREDIIRYTADSINASINAQKKKADLQRKSAQDAHQRREDLKYVKLQLSNLENELILEQDKYEGLKSPQLLRSASDRRSQLGYQLQVIQGVKDQIEEYKELRRKISNGKPYDLFGSAMVTDSTATAQ